MERVPRPPPRRHGGPRACSNRSPTTSWSTNRRHCRRSCRPTVTRRPSPQPTHRSQTDEERRLAVLLAARRAASVRDQQHAAFTVVIGEAVLRQQVGGSEAMLGQLGQLVDEAGGLPASVTLQVTPFTAGAHPAIGAGPMSIMRFRDVTGIGAIYQGWSADGVSVARQAELTAAVRRFEALRDAALSPEESLQLIRKVISGLAVAPPRHCFRSRRAPSSPGPESAAYSRCTTAAPGPGCGRGCCSGGPAAGVSPWRGSPPAAGAGACARAAAWAGRAR